MLKLKSDKSFWEFMRSGNSALRVGIVLLFGVVLILIGSMSGEQSNETISEGLEESLAEMCTSTEGVGRCRVMITYTDGGEEVYAVAVLCEGAESPEVRARVVKLVGSLFGIGSNRISVLKIGE